MDSRRAPRGFFRQMYTATYWLVAVCLLLCSPRPSIAAALNQIQLPPGFHIELYSDEVPGARSLALGDDGVVFVSTRRQGRVYALLDRDGDYRVDRVLTVLDGLDTPNGIAYDKGTLYVAENSRILRYDGIAQRLDRAPKPKVIRDDLPTEQHHGWRYLRLGPDGMLYVGIGAPCNICDEPGFAQIRRLRTDGSDMTAYAEGVRNTVGFDWHPETGELWFTDNGRDWLGDDQPPDELNRAPQAGMHFGYPYCHGDGIQDPEFGDGKNCSDYTPPVQSLGAHVASLGMRFYTGKQFPAQYRNQVFIAEHGSWNRSTKVGYQVSLVTLEGNRATSYSPFATGWLDGEQVSGRPVDLLVLPDGSMLVSDDAAGAVYRIFYRAP